MTRLKSDFPTPVVGNRYQILAGEFTGETGKCDEVKENDFGHRWAVLSLKNSKGKYNGNGAVTTVRTKLIRPTKKKELKTWTDNKHLEDDTRDVSQIIDGGP